MEGLAPGKGIQAQFAPIMVRDSCPSNSTCVNNASNSINDTAPTL